MSIEYAQRAVINHQQRIARLQDQKGHEAGRAADASKKAAAAAAAAMKATSSSTAQSKLTEAQRQQDDAVKHQRKVADYESQIAAEQKQLLAAEKRLHDERDRANRRYLDEQRRSARVHEEKMRDISGKLADHSRFEARMERVVDNVVKKLDLLPEKIVVLFVALEPRDQTQLALGEEVRAIEETIRKSEYRDSVKLESCWAVRPLDLLHEFNKRRPHVVHFAGHGSIRDELLFQDDQGATKGVSTEALVRLMATTGQVQLVFFNACHSRVHAEAVVQHVPAAIGMNAAIADLAARTFSAAFYSAIGFGLSVKQAFEQGRAALMLEGMPEESIPELYLGSGVDAHEVILVRPPGVDSLVRSPSVDDRIELRDATQVGGDPDAAHER